MRSKPIEAQHTQQISAMLRLRASSYYYYSVNFDVFATVVRYDVRVADRAESNIYNIKIFC